MSGESERPTGGRRRTAGAFDVRTVIALLFAIYGAVLVVVGLTATSSAELAKADGFNLNLWSGTGMLVFAAAFQAWAWLRPIAVPADEDSE